MAATGEMPNIELARRQLEEGFFDIDSSSDDDESNDNSSSSDDCNNALDDTAFLTGLKPSLKKGDKVWAAWWDLSSKNVIMNKGGAKWYEGTVLAVREVDRCGDESRASKYGPLRLYDIRYKDDDELNGVLDVFVLPEKDFLLTAKVGDEHWKGVRSVTDKSSSDWYARDLGWYNVSMVDGTEKSFSTLYEAMKIADEQIIERKDGHVHTDLNLPDDVLMKKRGRRNKITMDNEYDQLKKKTKKTHQRITFGSVCDSDENMEEGSSDDASYQVENDDGSSVRSKPTGEQANYTGVIYINGTKRYRGIIKIDRTFHQLGNYVLEADAAHAHDEYCRTKHISDKGFNFNTLDEYKHARSKEIVCRQLSLERSGTLAAIKKRIQVFKEKWGAEGNGIKKNRTNSVHSSSNNSDLSLVASTTKTSKYKGVEHNQRKEKHWTTVIFYNDKISSVGVYDLEADAARVHDVVASILNVSNGDPNFANECDHEKARKLEAVSLRLALKSIDSFDSSLEKAQIYVNNLLAEEAGTEGTSRKKSPTSTFTPVESERKKEIETITSSKKKFADLNDDMSSKWGSRLNGGSQFIENYQQNLAGMLGTLGEENNNNTCTEISEGVQKQVNSQHESEYEMMKEVEHEIEQRRMSSHTDNKYENSFRSVETETNEEKYVGITYIKGRDRFRGTVSYDCKLKAVGEYVLQADAAHARDEFCRSFNLKKPLNFNSEEEYEIARAKEIRKRRLTLDAVDTRAKKKDIISLSEVAAKLHGKKAKWEEESRQRVTNADDVLQTQEPSRRDDDSNDKYLASDLKDEQEKYDPSKDNATTMKLDPSEMNLYVLSKEQETSLEFPLGCRVLFQHGESFHRGVIATAWLDMNPPYKFVYDVDLLNGEKQKKTASDLAFDTNCPIYFQSSSTDNCLVEGEVLCSTNIDTVTMYTIQVFKEKKGNEFHLIQDIPSNLLRFRSTEMGNSSTSQRAIKRFEPNNEDCLLADQTSQSKMNLAKENQPRKLNLVGNERIGHCEMSASNSNCSISTKELHRSMISSGIGGNDSSWKEQSIDIELPKWFVYDNEAKCRLKYHLVGSFRGGRSIFDGICALTHCSLSILDESNTIRIETDPGSHAMENLCRTKIEVENALLKYLNHDGAIGRLFHDLALSCPRFHPQRGNFCIYQRNPWEPNGEMGYTSVVELPYIGKDFHGYHMLDPELRVLSRVKRAGCFMLLIQRSGRFPTQWCNPYVWVWGTQPGNVDTAVKILKDANQEHVNRCRCLMPN